MTQSPESENLSPGTRHLNTTGGIVRVSSSKGRGVYASEPIPRNTTIEISPVLFFQNSEYEERGKHTTLDHYTFVWPDGRMALALGLGSLFNHSDPPNVTFTFDTTTDSIQYATTRDIGPGEELCISYGHKLRSSPADATSKNNFIQFPNDCNDGRGGLSLADYDRLIENAKTSQVNPFARGDLDETLPEEDLPFRRYKLPPNEEDLESIRTIQAWVVDVPDPRLITTLLEWLKQTSLNTTDLAHLKRVRKQSNAVTFLLASRTTFPTSPPFLPEGLDLPPPHLHTVPASSALTPTQLALKTALWPTIYTPRKKDQQEKWSRGKASWAWLAMREAVQAAIQAHRNGELPIAAHIPAPYEEAPSLGNRPKKPGQCPVGEFTAHDTRTSTNHPLRHAVTNVIRKIADYHASISRLPPSTELANTGTEAPIPPEEEDGDGSSAALQNGSNYLLTSHHIFTTHEPCIMCSMALLHSRVREVIYLLPMPHTGGCGGIACLPTLKDVNHRYTIAQWRRNEGPVVEEVDADVDKILNIETTIDA